MGKLNENWLTEGLIDFEYKKYVLMAYLQDVQRQFRFNKLYPFLSELIDHYSKLRRLQKEKEKLRDSFPKYLNLEDFILQKLTYESAVDEDKISQELAEILNYALGQMKETMKMGQEVYDIVEENMEIIPVGIRSLYQNEGYMMLDNDSTSELKVYRYHITVFEGPNDTYRAIHTSCIEEVKKSISTTYESVRLMLVNKHKQLSNPATYVINARHTFPLEETMLPVAKRMLVRYVNVA